MSDEIKIPTIGLTHVGTSFPKEVIEKFEADLAKEGINFGKSNKAGKWFASSVDTTNEIIINNLVWAIIGGAVWELTKNAIIEIAKYGKTIWIERLQSGEITKHRPVNALTIVHDESKSVSYFFPDDLSTKTVNKGLNTLIEHSKKYQKEHEGEVYYHPNYKLTSAGLWKKVDHFQSKKKREASKETMRKIDKERSKKHKEKLKNKK